MPTGADLNMVHAVDTDVLEGASRQGEAGQGWRRCRRRRGPVAQHVAEGAVGSGAGLDLLIQKQRRPDPEVDWRPAGAQTAAGTDRRGEQQPRP